MNNETVKKKRGRKPHKDTPEMIQLLQKKAATATAITELADDLGVGATTIRRWMAKYGVELPKARRMDSASFQHSPRR
jgi:DNA invertase Pin-like site-specific DNA recombinase